MSEEELESLRRWKRHAYENHHAMSEWQLTVCVLLEERDKLEAENARLREHFDNCNSQRIVSLSLERNALVECVKEINGEVITLRTERDALAAKLAALEKELAEAPVIKAIWAESLDPATIYRPRLVRIMEPVPRTQHD